MRFRLGARLPPLTVFLFPFVARGEVFHDAEVHAPGTFEVSIEGQDEFVEGNSNPGSDHHVIGHAGVVIFDRTEVHAKAAILNRDFNYFGGEIRYGALPNGDGYPALMVYAGAHWIDRGSINADLADQVGQKNQAAGQNRHNRERLTGIVGLDLLAERCNSVNCRKLEA